MSNKPSRILKKRLTKSPAPLSDYELSLQNYFKKMIVGCVGTCLIEAYEKKRSEEVWELLEKVEQDLRYAITRFEKFADKYGCENPAPFLNECLGQFPLKTEYHLMMEENIAMDRSTNSKIDYRISISLLFTIDVFEKGRLSLDWLKSFLITNTGELYRELKVSYPDTDINVIRLPIVNEIDNSEKTERTRWKRKLKDTLRESLFKVEGARNKADGASYKATYEKFEEEMRKYYSYDNKSFFISEQSNDHDHLAVLYEIYYKPWKHELKSDEILKSFGINSMKDFSAMFSDSKNSKEKS